MLVKICGKRVSCTKLTWKHWKNVKDDINFNLIKHVVGSIHQEDIVMYCFNLNLNNINAPVLFDNGFANGFCNDDSKQEIVELYLMKSTSVYERKLLIQANFSNDYDTKNLPMDIIKQIYNYLQIKVSFVCYRITVCKFFPACSHLLDIKMGIDNEITSAISNLKWQHRVKKDYCSCYDRFNGSSNNQTLGRYHNGKVSNKHRRISLNACDFCNKYDF
jgi:hypothetical protein